MQLPRVIIAALFFLIGALIAIPALTHSASSRSASNPAVQSTLTPTASASARTSAKATTSAKAPSPSRTPTPQATKPVRPVPSHVTPKVTITPTVPVVVPLKATVTAVRCPGPEITVKVTNSGIVTEDYTIEQDGQVALADRVGPRATRSNPLTLKEGEASKIVVSWRNKPIRTVTRTPDCTTKTPAPTKLPHTGPDSAGLYAKVATGVAAMITGVIIFWWGGIWPRRRDHMFAGGRKSPRGSGKKDSE